MATEYSFLFEDVGFYYQKNNWVLRHLSFALPKNGFLAIVGKSGSGKSTFLSMLRFSLHPKEGKIKYGFSTPPAPVFQSALLLDYLTVKENILFGIELNRTKGDEFQKWISILDLEQLLTKIPPQLSGGEKIRVSIARALLMSSPVILLDEPTGQLDEKNSLKIYECLK
ncbi:MAG: ATP-binding cassette domain-containing protein, partial [Bacilli bacterium]